MDKTRATEILTAAESDGLLSEQTTLSELFRGLAGRPGQ
jgi:ribonucleoside-diphosphate reductase alpha chain